MSDFTFENDRAGTQTSVIDQPATGVQTIDDTPVATGTVSFANCSLKKLLAVMRAHSTVDVCGDVNILSGGEVFIEGTAGSSIVKEIGLAFGTYDEGTQVFTPIDPAQRQVDDTEAEDSDEGDIQKDLDASADGGDSTFVDGEDAPGGGIEAVDADSLLQGSGKWYLRVVRPNGSKEYLPLDPVNELLAGLSPSGQVKSILDVAENLAQLTEAVALAAESEFDARIADVNALEAAFDADVQSLQNWLLDFEYRLVQYIQNNDTAVLNDLAPKQQKLANDVASNHSAMRLHGTSALAINAACSGSGEIQWVGPDEILPAHADIKKWMVQVSILSGSDDGSGLVVTSVDHDTEIMFAAETEESSTSVLDADGNATSDMYHRMKITTNPVFCEDSNVFMAVKAIYCGDQPQLVVDNSVFGSGDLAQAPLSEATSHDSDSGESDLVSVATPAAFFTSGSGGTGDSHESGDSGSSSAPTVTEYAASLAFGFDGVDEYNNDQAIITFADDTARDDFIAGMYSMTWVVVPNSVSAGDYDNMSSDQWGPGVPSANMYSSDVSAGDNPGEMKAFSSYDPSFWDGVTQVKIMKIEW